MLKRQQFTCSDLPIIYNTNNYTRWLYSYNLNNTIANGIQYASLKCILNPGVLFVPGDREFGVFFPGMFVSGKNMISPMKDNSEMEVMHFRRDFRRGYTSHKALENQFWYYHAPGSSIFLNMGKILWKIVYSFNYVSCSFARKHNYDTIVYQHYQSPGTGITQKRRMQM